MMDRDSFSEASRHNSILNLTFSESIRAIRQAIVMVVGKFPDHIEGKLIQPHFFDSRLNWIVIPYSNITAVKSVSLKTYVKMKIDKMSQ